MKFLTDRVKRQDTAATPEGVKFLMKRGLKRDKANYVTTLIRQRAELEHLRKLTVDEEVRHEIGTLSGFMAEEIELMYSMEAHGGTAA